MWTYTTYLPLNFCNFFSNNRWKHKLFECFKAIFRDLLLFPSSPTEIIAFSVGTLYAENVELTLVKSTATYTVYYGNIEQFNNSFESFEC